MNLDKLRNRTRKNWKKEQRAKFKFLMSCAEECIFNATAPYCQLVRPSLNRDYFALWLVAKKLEAKGFTCNLDRKLSPSKEFYFDTLTIWI